MELNFASNQTATQSLTFCSGFSARLIAMILVVTVGIALTSGCASSTPKWIEQPWAPIDFEAKNDSETNELVSIEIQPNDTDSDQESVKVAKAKTNDASNVRKDDQDDKIPSQGRGLLVDLNTKQASHNQVIRGQDGGYPLDGRPGSYVPPTTAIGGSGQFAPQGQSYSPQTVYQNAAAQGQQTQQPVTGGYQIGGQQPVVTQPMTQTYQVPAAAPGQLPLPNTGDPNQDPLYVAPNSPVGNYSPPNFADLDVMVREAQTGKMTFGAAYNSNSGLVGQIIIDERNFDILNFPRSIQDIVDGTAWKGRGQGFRLELVPGDEVQRYMVSFTDPYFLQTDWSFSASGYFFDRRYEDWDEQRLGGRLSLGYRLTPDLSLSVGLRMENVNIHDPRVNTSPSLNAVLGDNSLFLGQVSLINDTRDHPFMASSGSYLELSFYQGFGDFSYPRGEVDYRRYFLISQRPDLSGRHTLSVGTKLGFSGTNTPIYENYFPGGFSTMRGFDFRGIAPLEGDVRVGGRFQWLNTVEYTFPITADDMFKGVLFCDFGTVEQDIEFNNENFRVAPGFGFRVHMPVGGAGGAPLAFDFAFPVSDAEGDDRQTFSFYMSAIR